MSVVAQAGMTLLAVTAPAAVHMGPLVRKGAPGESAKMAGRMRARAAGRRGRGHQNWCVVRGQSLESQWFIVAQHLCLVSAELGDVSALECVLVIGRPEPFDDVHFVNRFRRRC
jgi:hypothetical protein